VLNKIIGYEVHLGGFGWHQGFVYDGMGAGTIGHAVRIEAIVVTGLPPGFQYRAHVAGPGWLSWLNPGEVAGTTGESRALEALQFRWTGPNGAPGEVWGRAYVAQKGWLDVTSGMNSDYFGTTGQSLQMEAIQLWFVVPQDGRTGRGLVSRTPAFTEIIADSQKRQQYLNPAAMIGTAAETKACMASLGTSRAVCLGTEGLRCLSDGAAVVTACTATVTDGVAMFGGLAGVEAMTKEND